MSLQLLGSLAALIGTNAPLMREAARTKPITRNAKDATPALQQAMIQRMKDVDAKDIPKIKLNPITPEQAIDDYKTRLKTRGMYSPELIDQMNLPLASAPLFNAPIRGQHARTFGLDDNGKLDRSKYLGTTVSYNPNADSAVLAHELGHAVSGRTKVGEVINTLRHNPKLTMALAAATGVIPVVAAAATPGDDEYDEAILGTAALAAPTLIDEGLATKNALAMMNTADMRATLGQRGKLASGLLSYLAVPMIAGTGGTALGNLFDENVPAQ
jgi:hypothetical protein